jgi:hypothetical protein
MEVAMRTTSFGVMMASWLVVSAAFAQESSQPKTKSVAKSPADRLIVRPSDQLTWTDLDPKGAPGVKVADLWGDHTKGGFGAYFKLPAGFAVPLHTHTHDMKVVFVSGTYIQAPEGKSEFRLGPGSYMMQPGGAYKHTTSCDKTSDCVFFVTSTGAFDLKLVEPVKPSDKKQ